MAARPLPLGSHWIEIYKDKYGNQLQVGDRADVDMAISTPDWTTGGGRIISMPGPTSDFYGYPRMEWESDGLRRHVPNSWLIKRK
jgi:hypothetical protein